MQAADKVLSQICGGECGVFDQWHNGLVALKTVVVNIQNTQLGTWAFSSSEIYEKSPIGLTCCQQSSTHPHRNNLECMYALQ